MKRVTCELRGVAPLGYSKAIHSEKGTGEGHDAFEKRTWKERAHVDGEKRLIIPPQSLKNCLVEVAQYLGETVPGKRTATFTKHFEAGIMLTEPMAVMSNGKQVHLDDVACDRVFVPSDGKRGGGKRVWRHFPLVKTWTLKPLIHVLDPILQDDLPRIERYLTHAGEFIGLGYFRPRRNGYYGRFTVHGFKEVACE